MAAELEAFFATHPEAQVYEDGKLLFAMNDARYALSTAYGKCTLQLWSEDRNITRRVTEVLPRKDALRLRTLRFGHTKPSLLDIAGQAERRAPSSRETTRTRFLPVVERMLTRQFPEWNVEALRTAMDLEKSFGPAYARGLQTKGQQTWAVVAVNDAETPATVDGILTVGVLWLAECRERSQGKRVVRGLRMLVPRGRAALTAARLAWMNNEAAQWELWEFDPRTEELEQRDAADHGNLHTHLVHAPRDEAAQERFHDEIARVLALVPEAERSRADVRVRSGGEVAFLLHGLQFARVRSGYAGDSFARQTEITFGSGPEETELRPSTEGRLAEQVAELFRRRNANGEVRDPLFRTQSERWLESELRHDLSRLDAHLNADHVYSQVPAFAASDRGMLDLLSVLEDGRLAVIELKADDDLHLALQGLDYWVRVRWHQMQTADSSHGPSYGLGEFQRHGYFAGVPLSEKSPKLYLVAPALRIHPATEIVLRHLSPRVEWELVALDERWREQIRVVWRKRSGDALRATTKVPGDGNR
jgi:hypothetical protein